MHISYVTTYDAADVHQWSGLGFNIAQALRHQGAELDFVGNIDTPVTKYMELKGRIYNRLGKGYLFDRVPWLVRSNARQADSHIKPGSDIIFAPSTLPLALMESNKPKVFYTDATFAGMLNYYPYFTNLSAESIRNGNMLEQAAFNNCKLAIYSSSWAAKTAVDNYKVDPQKIKVVPFGANIESRRTAADIDSITRQKDPKTCHLLFLGVEWERKGGPMALEVVKQLNAIGQPAMLHIAGIPQEQLPDTPSFVKCYGFVSKRTPEGAQLLNDLFTRSHFLLLPSNADCTPIVYAEANSFGLPCITTDVGGIPDMITDNVNGRMFNLTDHAADYAGYIAQVYHDQAVYADLARSSFNEYATRLNWDASGRALMALLNAL